MKNIFKISKSGIIVILTLCIFLGIAGTCVNVTAMAAETTVTTEETAVTIESTIPELMPTMARGCYDYATVGECMSAISSKYDFSYSPSGNGYTCSGNYSVSINNSHDYLNVILNLNGSCIAMYTCGQR